MAESSRASHELRQSIRFLALEVPAQVWDDVNAKVEAVLAENAQLRAQRDSYRRRWLVHGIRYPYHLAFKRESYVAAVMGCLTEAQAADA